MPDDRELFDTLLVQIEGRRAAAPKKLAAHVGNPGGLKAPTAVLDLALGRLAMSFAESNSPVDTSPTAELLAHAKFRAAASPSGIGAAVVRSGWRGGEHHWDCIVTDGEQWHYVQVIGRDIGPYPALYNEAIERGVERFASELPDGYRLYGLVNANPLHVNRRGEVGD